jgi:uncharacterized protein YfkK (UPF0435 family)
MNVILLCNYGIYDKEIRSEVEFEGLRDYYRALTKYLQKCDTKPILVSCGGRTNPHSELTEADSYSRYLDDEGLYYFINQYLQFGQIVTENLSNSSEEAIVFGILAIRNVINLVNKITIICDRPRQKKLQKLSETLIGDRFEVDVISFKREDIHPNNNPEYQTNVSLPNILASRKLELLIEILRFELQNNS